MIGIWRQNMVVENRIRLSNIHKDLQNLASEQAYMELERKFTEENNQKALLKLREIKRQERNMLENKKPVEISPKNPK